MEKDYHKKYYKKNKEKHIKQVIKWREEHKQDFLTYQRKKQKEYRIKYPLKKILQNINQRCRYLKDKKYKYYGGKGIKCLLSYKQLEYLWERDKAYNLNQPSIDRKNSNKNYTVRNCQFIEMEENRKNKKKNLDK